MDRKTGALGGRLSLSWTEIATGAAVIVLGLILAIVPGLATSVLFNVIGVGCIVIGVAHVIRYFRLDARSAVFSNDMAEGLGWIIVGILVCIFKDLLKSLPPFLFGLAMLVGGVCKIQITLGFRRMKVGRWYWELICAAISVALGLIILVHALEVSELLIRVIGVSLIVESVMDMASRVAFKRACDRFVTTFVEE